MQARNTFFSHFRRIEPDRMPLSKVCEAPKTAEVSIDSTLKNGNKSVEKKLAPDFWQFRLTG